MGAPEECGTLNSDFDVAALIIHSPINISHFNQTLLHNDNECL